MTPRSDINASRARSHTPQEGAQILLSLRRQIATEVREGQGGQGWVVCVGVYCSSLTYKWGRVRGCGCTFGGGVHLCVPTQACVRTCTPAYMCTGAHKRPNLCALLRTDAPPSAPGCVWVCARQRPYIILSPSRLFLSNFSGPPFDLEPKRNPPLHMEGSYLLKANACEILSKIGALGNRAPYD